jgi:hypothetical protein
MFAFHGPNVTVAAATALVALSLSLPASAQQSAPASQPASEALQANAADVPTPRVRPPARKRVAKPVSVRRYVARPYWFMRPPVQRVVYRPPVQQVVAAHWPMLFVGVGF